MKAVYIADGFYPLGETEGQAATVTAEVGDEPNEVVLRVRQGDGALTSIYLTRDDAGTLSDELRRAVLESG